MEKFQERQQFHWLVIVLLILWTRHNMTSQHHEVLPVSRQVYYRKPYNHSAKPGCQSVTVMSVKNGDPAVSDVPPVDWQFKEPQPEAYTEVSKVPAFLNVFHLPLNILSCKKIPSAQPSVPSFVNHGRS